MTERTVAASITDGVVTLEDGTTFDCPPTHAELDTTDAGGLPDDQRLVFDAVPEVDAVAIAVELHSVVVELRRIVDIMERPSLAMANILHR